MVCLGLRWGSPVNLYEIERECKSQDELIGKLNENPKDFIFCLQYMWLNDQNNKIASRFLYRVNPNDLPTDSPEEKAVMAAERTLRNRGVLQPLCESNLNLIKNSNQMEFEVFYKAHRSILACESPFFRVMQKFEAENNRPVDRLTLNTEDFSDDIQQLAIQYLYLSNIKRKELITELNDIHHVVELLKIGAFLQHESLRDTCESELCNKLSSLNINKEEIDKWIQLAEGCSAVKLACLLNFVKRLSCDQDMNLIIDQMESLEASKNLVSNCTDEEIYLFRTIKTQFGRQLRFSFLTTAFGANEWENFFGVNVDDIPDVPDHLFQRLAEPCDFCYGEKMKEPYLLVLIPKGMTLNMLEQLIIGNKIFDRFLWWDQARKRYGDLPMTKSYWVVMTKTPLEDTLARCKKEQIDIGMRYGCIAPNTIEAVVCNIINYIRGDVLETQGWQYTLCREQEIDYSPIVVGLSIHNDLLGRNATIVVENQSYIPTSFIGVWH